MLTALRTGMTPLGVNSFATYSGDLEAENLKKELASYAKSFPRVLVSYTDGVDTQDAKTARVLGNPIHFRHDCWFAVIVASNDARSDKVRRRGLSNNALGTYAMIAKVREILTGLMIRKQVSGNFVPLTHEPLIAMSNEYVMRIPNITAYAVIFRTFFRWSSPDRTAAGIAINTLDLTVTGTNNHGGNIGDGKEPGVHFLVQEN